MDFAHVFEHGVPLWHCVVWDGNLHDGMAAIEDLVIEMDEIERGYPSIKALRQTVADFQTHVANNADMIPKFEQWYPGVKSGGEIRMVA